MDAERARKLLLKQHDLFLLMDEATAAMAAKYERIRARSKEDPGTAGDQGEEDWARLLRDWLPSTYRVVTKGRVLFANGDATPQVDVLVLAPSYPEGLLDTKMYLAAGVVAAFECKTTLRPRHLTRAVRTGARLGELSRADESVVQRPLYGSLSCDPVNKTASRGRARRGIEAR